MDMIEGVSQETIDAFSRLREPVSRLLSLPSVGAGNAQDIASTLRTIHTILTTMPDPDIHLTVKLIAYIQHALNHVLLLCQNFMLPEKRFDFVVDAWASCLEFLLRLPDGYAFIMGPNWQYDQMLFNVLFRAIDGLPIKSLQPQQSKPKDIAKDRMPDETRLGTLKCLILALPLDTTAPAGISEHDQGYGSSIQHHEEPLDDFARARVPADDKVRGYLLEAKSQPVLGQMIVVLLDVAKEADLVALRRIALLAVLKLLKCLETPERIAPWIPGISAGLTKAMLERGLKESHIVLTTALDTWTFMVVRVLESLGSSRQPLQDSSTTGAGLSEGLMAMFKEQQGVKKSGSASTPSPPERFGSDAWIKRTEHGLSTLFKQIAKLRTHSHWNVRRHFAEMSFRILSDCQGALVRKSVGSATTSVPGFLLETLIGCTQDEFDDVSLPAKAHLGALAEEYGSQELADVGKQIVRERLAALSRILHGANEAAKQDAIRLAQGLVLFLGHQMEFIVNQQSLANYLQPWIQVLAIEQLDQHNMDERRGILGVISPSSSAISPGNEEERWHTWIKERKGSGRKFGFPRRIHLHLREQSTSNAFLGFLRQLGSATEIDTWSIELTSRLQDAARAVRENQGWFSASDVSSVLMMNQLLIGASGIGLATMGDFALQGSSTRKRKGKVSSKSSHKKNQRHIRRAARGVLDEYMVVLVECSQLSVEARTRQEMEERSRSAEAAELNSRSKKAILARMFGMDGDEGEELAFESTGPVEYDHNTDIMLRCLLLEGIASIAVILGGAEFEMELVRVLYILLEHLGDQDSALIRDSAEVALEHVAFVCQYETVGDLIQANYDYVIQQISQRIAFLSSNPKTPQVLWALIHVVGPPAVSMLEDSVTEIFEALDHWKDQEDEVCEGLLKSLCEIVKVMAGSTATVAGGTKEGVSETDPALTKNGAPAVSSLTDSSKEIESFAKEYQILTKGVGADTEEEDKAMQDKLDSMTPEQIKDYFMDRAKKAKEDEERLFGEREDMDKVDDPEDAEDNENISFGELRASMPKQAEASKPDPLTKHQALCLRILTKAGYFLTATSPRLRILALEIIQGSIVVLKDRPQELNPVIHGFWAAIVGRVLRRSELEVFFVSLRAIEVITALAENCSDFLGRHLLDDVWPFIVKALRAWTPSVDGGSKGGNSRKSRADDSMAIGPGYGHGHRTPKQAKTQGKVFTREHRLQMTTLVSVSKIVRRIRIPVQEIWMMLLLTIEMVLDQDGLLHRDVREAAAEVIRSMAIAGHGDSVYIVLEEAVRGRGVVVAQDEVVDEEEKYGLQTCMDILSFMDMHGL
ncbi:TEL2-interacting protein 1 [Linnemannia exigua]|uniref:TEL2-interacting protein 1 n=1 Tax=Linnemannia exigua TaxID=604196 RepID=A0AAD4DJP2_9FUNG|nr:TEL2-interacting protein 1 [Linnemannia exigua]